ncbi:MAG: hypothetical protein AAGG51_08900 [Cyanobacteria bacterium P01_G01_bin.54]
MPFFLANIQRRSNPQRQFQETQFSGGFQTLPYLVGLEMTYYLALHHPLILTVPDLHWLIGSSFTCPAARRWLQLCEILVLLLAAAFEPSPLTILLLRRCFALLGNR